VDITKDNILKILNVNFAYKMIDSVLGPGVVLSPVQSFIYCNITGAGYLNNITFPYSPKGLMKIFHTACACDMVTGLFDKYMPKYTPKKICSRYGFIFDKPKTLIPIEVASEQEYFETLEKMYNCLEKYNLQPHDFVVQRIECSKKGNGMEPFMEFLACEKFKHLGYITENQVPLGHSIGSPDFMAFRSENFHVGLHLIEFALLFLTKSFNNINFHDVRSIYDLVVGEAKTSTTQMVSQIEKYTKTGYYNKQFGIHPNNIAVGKGVGLIYLDNNLNIVIKPSQDNVSDAVEYKNWLFNSIKAYLLVNLYDEQLVQLYNLYIGKIPVSDIEFYDFLQKVDAEHILNVIKEG
jgi:hypothetical protein